MDSDKKEEEKLGQWLATGVCGNDITSSCLYVSAYAIRYAGGMGVISLLLVAGLLYLFRGIYAEVVGALPLNGGAYNALLNTTSKLKASIAACLTILSYLATAVISAYVAVQYGLTACVLLGAHPDVASWNVELTIAILLFFAYLTYLGIGESAKVALAIFIFHISILALLAIAAAIYIFNNGLDLLILNWDAPPPEPIGLAMPLFFGFCVSLLGISGFESSANFVEEQKKGVFPKTLRNMWISVAIINPLIAILILATIPIGDVTSYKDSLLIHLGNLVGGTGFGTALGLLVAVDAAFVLCGAVLTSYIGVTGLVHRMTLDRCLPQFLLKKSKHQTFWLIIFAFFILCSSLLWKVDGDVDQLAGVYTISFLLVMLLFTIGNALLKIKRSRLPRDVRVSWITLLFAGTAVFIGIIGNAILINPNYPLNFAIYFLPAVAIVFAMLTRTTLLKVAIAIVRGINNRITILASAVSAHIQSKLDQINSQCVVFFTRGDNMANLMQALLYVKHNEHTSNIKIVTVIKDESEIPKQLTEDLDFLNRAFPEIEIEFVAHTGSFSPAMLKELSQRWNIPLNFMFIGSPGDHFPHNISELGGVRLII